MDWVGHQGIICMLVWIICVTLLIDWCEMSPPRIILLPDSAANKIRALEQHWAMIDYPQFLSMMTNAQCNQYFTFHYSWYFLCILNFMKRWRDVLGYCSVYLSWGPLELVFYTIAFNIFLCFDFVIFVMHWQYHFILLYFFILWIECLSFRIDSILFMIQNCMKGEYCAQFHPILFSPN